MKRPFSMFFLLMFAILQIYLVKSPSSRQVQTTSWLTVSAKAGGLVGRNGTYYLVTPHESMKVVANGAHIAVHAGPLNWVDVPEPSGAGVWHVAMNAARIPLVGIAGAVYLAPNGTKALWVDTGTRQLYFSQPPLAAMQPVQESLGDVRKVVWAPDGDSAAILGRAGSGTGIYLWAHGHTLQSVLILQKGLQVTNFGVTRTQSVVAALADGKVWWQGHGVAALPAMRQLRVSSQHAAALGMSSSRVLFWESGHTRRYPIPSHVKWVGVPRFSQDGQFAAILSQSSQGIWHLLMYGERRSLDVRMPFDGALEYHLLGFVGEHWILVTVPSGPHQGTYAWWVTPLD